MGMRAAAVVVVVVREVEGQGRGGARQRRRRRRAAADGRGRPFFLVFAGRQLGGDAACVALKLVLGLPAVLLAWLRRPFLSLLRLSPLLCRPSREFCAKHPIKSLLYLSECTMEVIKIDVLEAEVEV